MMLAAFQKLRGAFLRPGAAAKDGPGTPFFNASEIASLRQQLNASSDRAIETARRHGVQAHPRVLEIKARAAAAKAG